MRVRARLTSLTAVAAALAILAPMAPANAVPPTVSGEHLAFTSAVTRTIVADECRDVAELKYLVDLVSIGNQIQAQGFYPGYYAGAKDEPVYTRLDWSYEYRLTGPDSFYADSGSTVYNPDNQETLEINVCPDDFGAGRVSAGTYSVEASINVSANAICSQTDPCTDYPNVYQRTVSSSFVLDYSPLCYDARAKVAELTPKVKKAKKALKRAKASHDRAKIKRAKKKLRKLERRLVTARSNVEGLC